jgi:dynein heavy chain
MSRRGNEIPSLEREIPAWARKPAKKKKPNPLNVMSKRMDVNQARCVNSENVPVAIALQKAQRQKRHKVNFPPKKHPLRTGIRRKPGGTINTGPMKVKLTVEQKKVKSPYNPAPYNPDAAMAVDSLNDTLANPNFLHIDESKLPLALFDSHEFESYSPQEWLAIDSEGFGLLYESGEWHWAEAEILGYDEEKERYQIRYKASGIKKLVGRLGLRFKSESETLFNARQAYVRAARERCKASLRLDHYIRCMDSSLINRLSKAGLRRIMALAGVDVTTLTNTRLKEIVAEVMNVYINGIKRGSIFYKVRNNAEFHKEYKMLRLLELPQALAPPLYGKVQVPSSYLKAKVFVHENLISGKQVVLKLQQWLVSQLWCGNFKAQRFVKTNRDELKLPMRLHSFHAYQQKHLKQTIELFLRGWRRALAERCVDFLQDTYNIFQSSSIAFETGPLKRVLKNFNLHLQTQLREAVQETCGDWVLFFESFLAKNESKSSFRIIHDTLFHLELVADAEKGVVEFQPRINEFEDMAMNMLDAMVEATTQFDTIDSQILTLLQLNPEPLTDIGTKNCIYAYTDAIIAKAREDLKSFFQNAAIKPQAVADKFHKVCHGLVIDARVSATEFMTSDPMPKLKDIDARIKHYWDMIDQIQDLGFNLESMGPFALRLGNAKKNLSDKASKVVNIYCELLANYMETNCAQVIEGYEDILRRISRKPANEAELKALNIFLEDVPAEVEKMQADVALIFRQMKVLEKYEYRVPFKLFELTWSTVEWPQKVKERVEEALYDLDKDKNQMVVALEKERLEYQESLAGFAKEVELFAQYGEWDQIEVVVDKAYTLERSLNEALERGKEFNERETVIGFHDLTDYSILDKLTKDFDPYLQVWSMASDFITKKAMWLNGPFLELDGPAMEKDVSKWWQMSYKLKKSLERSSPGAASIAAQLREEVTAFRDNLPIVTSLASKALRERHWITLSDGLEAESVKNGGKRMELTPDDDLTLMQLTEMHITDHWEFIEGICMRAEKEFRLEQNLEAMKMEWDEINFELMAYRNTGSYVLKGTDDIATLLDDQIVKAQTMLGSSYIKPIIEVCRKWEKRLQYIQELLEEWLTCQRTWMYLEPIFGSDDIMRQMPTEGRRFNTVDRTWRKIMQDTFENPRVLTVGSKDTLLPKFRECNDLLDKIQKGLSDYLEIKRLVFPRFYFLSNDELLEILSQTKDPTAVQPFLGKCFEGCNKVRFEGSGDDISITAMIDNKGEVVELDEAIYPQRGKNKGNVEEWLLTLQARMRTSMKDIVKSAKIEYPEVNPSKRRIDWIVEWPGQVVICIGSLYWTMQVEEALRTNTMSAFLVSQNKQLMDLVEMVRGKLTKQQKISIGALCVIDVHARDTVQQLVTDEVTGLDAFGWTAQLRYYWEHHPDDYDRYGSDPMNIIPKICNSWLLYGYEYVGNSSRLVITPLTDRCYRTMMGAVALMYGGAPAGPAGTGKTETVKDLSKAVAIQCVVFNCSDGLDFRAMAKFFKGLAASGAWACFDEFNRIELEVLSVIAQQLLTILKAKRIRAKRFQFEGTDLPLNPDCNSFITMNPGYAGRSELPDNLAALFRPCAMMVPDYALIAEIKLYSFGFEDGRNMARKLVQVLQLCSEQLSNQKHYDYGMRAVFSILVRAGNLRSILGDTWTEDLIVLSAITDVNLPKFTTNDIPLFRGICADLFPGVKLPVPDYGPLIPTIRKVCDRKNLIQKEEFVRAVVQLYETVMVRHGLMVVGETMSGKTNIIHTLAEAMTEVAEDKDTYPTSDLLKTNVTTINPKSITQGQLYGSFDPNTHEWADGVLAVIYRNLARDSSGDRNWILFDGPVDAVWIENMNTVLDDNKKLCLTSGEIIKMNDTMTMMFETEDLEEASPATVSRVGMVFVEQIRLGWKPLMGSWFNTLPSEFEEHKKYIQSFLQFIVPPATFFALKLCTLPGTITLLEVVRSFLNLLGIFLSDLAKNMPSPKKVKASIEGLALLATVWSSGVVSNQDARKRFNEWLLRICSGRFFGSDKKEDDKLSQSWSIFVKKSPDWSSDNPEPEARKIAVPLAADLDLYMNNFDATTGKWILWMKGQKAYNIPAGTQFSNILVPTVDVVRNSWVLHALVMDKQNVMCTGETGTAKTVIIKNLLAGLDTELYDSIELNFSAQTSANMTQDIIDGRLGKRRKGVFGPPLGKNCIVFVDDVNMPKKEIYGAQPPIEILRQAISQGGWYDRAEATFRNLVDLQFVGAMGPPGGGKTQVTQRFLRHFNLINFIPFNGESLHNIFSCILDWFLTPFPAGIKRTSSKVVSTTIELYNTVKAHLLPTPAKIHYTFNLRDVAKVFQGMLAADKKTCPDEESFLRVWGHETLRVFQDRLINDEDRKWFENRLSELCENSFKRSWDKVRGDASTIIYCHFAVRDEDYYQQVTNFDEMQSVIEEALDDYNAINAKKMDLVLFLNAIEHVSRVSRVIRQSQGNALLVGVGGSGRRSLTRLAVSAAQFEIFEIAISKVYGLTEWRDDLKNLFRMAGMDNKETVFLFSETQIKTETFIEDINNILNTGQVPNLFLRDELGEIMETITPAAKEAGIDVDIAGDMFNFFVQRCRKNTHVVLAFSPIGESFRQRLLMFPALVNCCTIDWFTEWPQEALKSVAERFLKKIELPPATKDGVVSLCTTMQRSVFELSKRFQQELGRYFYVTPTSYLNLISTFSSQINTKRDEVSSMKSRYDNGLEKLNETEEMVDGMQKELVALAPKLKIAQAETDAMLVKIEKMTTEANKTKEVVASKEKSTSEQAAAANKIKTECERELAVAIPTLNAALKALNTLKKSDITEVKSMKTPPGGVVTTMEAVCIMLGVKPTKVPNPDGRGKIDDYWGVSKKKVLSDPKFLPNLVAYDKDAMSESLVNKVMKYTNDADFAPDRILKQSKAAAGLCKWVHAMVSYYHVAKIVEPKKAALAIAEAELGVAMESLGVVQAELQAVVDKLAKLQSDLDQTMAKKNKLENDVATCKSRLDRAHKLMDGLGGEKVRWAESSASLQIRFDNLVGDILLSSGVIAYMGPFTSAFRDDTIAGWVELLSAKEITTSDNFSLTTCLGDAVQIREWTIARLPNDGFSIDNAIMLFKSDSFPLMIDPQGQANNWIRALEGAASGAASSNSSDDEDAPKVKKLKVIKQSEATFVRSLEIAVQYGDAVLLENVPEELDPVLESVLLKQVVKAGGMQSIKVGDNMVEYDPNFRLYITTKLRNPHYPPETCVKVNLLNFMATPDGLEDQMLGIVVKQEKPELEKQREQLVISDAANKKTLKGIEDTILHLLAVSEGNILDDQNLIDTLAASQVTSKEIADQVRAAAKTQEIIRQVRAAYQPVAYRVAQLFFCVADLASVDPMYQYSLDFYIGLLTMSIERANKSDVMDERTEALMDTFVWILYENICRSLFEKDKLLFSFLLCTKILISSKVLDPGHFRFLLAGSTAMSIEEPNPSKRSGWLPDNAWKNILALNKLKGFDGFSRIFVSQLSKWKQVLDIVEPMPLIQQLLGDEHSYFDAMMVLRSLRPDKVIPAVQEFIASNLGQKFVESPAVVLDDCYEDSACDRPLLFVLTPGSAPMDALMTVAEKLGFGNKLFAVSLGQGQGPIAANAITEAVDKGTWVCLQNCHLAKSWMPTLEKLCEQITPQTTHPAFRLWLTSMPAPFFPVYILQNSVKMTSEPPRGIRANLLGSYAKIEDSWFSESSAPHVLKKMCFGLCFLHANLRERRKYGPLGWNIPYEFSEMDLVISRQQLRMFVDECNWPDNGDNAIPFMALAYLAGECNYGGRVTDDKDRRCLNTIIKDIYKVDILRDDYRFTISGKYYAPPEGAVNDYVDYIRGLPLNDYPEVFELHENANITSAVSETNALLSTTLSLQSRSASGEGMSWDESVNSLCTSILERLPQVYDVEKVLIDYPIIYSESMNTVLSQELGRYNRLLEVLLTSLHEMQRSIRGEVVMSAELLELGTSMVNGLVPEMWHKAAYPSLKPLGTWVTDLLARFEMFDRWIAEGSPAVYWISGFYFTQAFLTGTRQNYARKYTIPIDMVKFDFKVLPNAAGSSITEKAEDGAFIDGLFMVGAGWDDSDQTVRESEPKQLDIKMPVIQIVPLENKEFKQRHAYECPVYKTSLRQGMLSTTGHSTNFVVMCILNCKPSDDPDHWIKRGTAMLTQLDD